MAQEYVRDLVKEIRDLIKKIDVLNASVLPGSATAANQVLEIAEVTSINDKTLTPISRKIAFDDINAYYYEIVTFDTSTSSFVYYYRDKNNNVIIPDFNSFAYGEERIGYQQYSIASDTSSTRNILNNLSKDTGNTIDTLRVVLEDQSRNTLENINFDVWDKIAGNSKVFTWITGPGGSQVVSIIEYFTGASLIITQTFTYDVNDNVTSITAS